MNFLFAKLRLSPDKKIAFPVILWFALAFIAVSLETLRHSYNNYYIYKAVFQHVIHGMNLYAEYPAEYFDTNHYGPLFSLVIAPFTFFPDWLGVILWSLTNAAVLFYAIKLLDFEEKTFYSVLLISAIEMMTATHNVQYNPMVTGFIILSYVMVEKEKDFWATLFIAAGFLTKLYGIAGLTFFLFSKHKVKFIASFVFWMVVLFALPMLISSPAYIIQCYKDWRGSLSYKDAKNANLALSGGMQDISVIGIVRRTTNNFSISDIMLLGPAAIAFALPLLRRAQYQFAAFRLRYLALALIMVVIFSSSAESPTYVIAVTGVAIWYVIQEQKTRWINAALIFVLCVTSLSATDLCPSYFKIHVIKAYALKALPCFIVWVLLIKEVASLSFNDKRTKQEI